MTLPSRGQLRSPESPGGTVINVEHCGTVINRLGTVTPLVYFCDGTGAASIIAGYVRPKFFAIHLAV